MSFLDRHAARTDRYVDALQAADVAAGDVPADARLDPEIRRAARALRATLVRVHPSFRFEERLAAELAMAAGVEHRAVVVGPRQFDYPGRPPATPFGVPFAVPPAAVRPIVVGGALSLAGAALFAWRRAHGQPGWPSAGLPAFPTRPPFPTRSGIRGGTA